MRVFCLIIPINIESACTPGNQDLPVLFCLFLNRYRISSISLRAYYHFSKCVDVQTIQGGASFKGVNYYFEFWTLKVL